MIELGHKPRFKNTMALTPLVDVIFMLIIFFMFAGSITRPDPFDIALPDATGTAPLPPASVVIDISGFGDLALNGEARSRAALKSTIGAWVETTPDLDVVVRADKSATTGDLMATLRLLGAAGVISFRLATQPAEGASDAGPDS